MGKFLEFKCLIRNLLGMMATTFLAINIAGGVIFGLAPASATLMSLYGEQFIPIEPTI